MTFKQWELLSTLTSPEVLTEGRVVKSIQYLRYQPGFSFQLSLDISNRALKIQQEA